MTPYSLFVVDDEAVIRKGLAAALGMDYQVSVFSDAEAALAKLSESQPDLILLDIGLPGMNGLEALKQMKAMVPDLLVIMITAYEGVENVISAMKAGAHDYVVKPIQMDGLEVTIQNALDTVRLRKEVRLLQERFISENLPCFIGESEKVQDMLTFLGQVAQSPDTPILILGETGTGKELLAEALHYHSPNYKGHLVTVNCAAIPQDLIESEIFGYEKGAFSGAGSSGKKGLIEDAANGTLFLDEVGDLSLEAQAKLLRFLENGEFYKVGGTNRQNIQTRVVSATNKDLEAMVTHGEFRKDLFFRLGVIKLNVPALNERQDDVILLARYFLEQFGTKFEKAFTHIAPAAEEALINHPWTGNVRELKNLIERGALVSQGPELTMRDLGIKKPPKQAVKDDFTKLPPMAAEGVDLSAIQESIEKYYIDEALKMAKGNESQAARLLNINLHTFRYRKKKLAQP
ncbi:MAG: sigma-54-dependent Fis family transcriptional regulator [Desulfobacterales bacterium]|nr:sigma-54-dependent Fis family transcriptional regulator [Desulfobacterales bacterium]